MTDPKTQTLNVPDAILHYDVRANDDSDDPVLLLIGSPMAAAGFGTLAAHFPDRTVVTYDPRGCERSIRTDGATQTTPDEHADDLHRLISEVSDGPVDLREQRRDGFGPAMAKSIALVSLEGPIPAEFADHPAPDPAAFGLPTEDDGSRNDPLVGQNMVPSTHYQHDIDALRAASTHVVLAVGENPPGRWPAGRARRWLSGSGSNRSPSPATTPGLGGEYGQTGEPDAFAAKLREVLSSAG